MLSDKPNQQKRRCHRCSGHGRMVCEICGGRREVLKSTDATGKQHFTRCDGCYGLGTRRCTACNGDGFAT